MTTTTSPAIRRAPNGMERDKPVPVRFSSAERANFKQIADSEQRSLASVTRLLALRGLEDYARHPGSLTRAA